MPAFSIFTQKKQKRPDQKQAPATEYYKTAAQRVSVAKVSVLFVLVVFIAFGFIFFGSQLTVENFRYMLKFMSVERNQTGSIGNVISFDSGEKPEFMVLNGDIAIVNVNGTSIYDTTGQRLIRQSATFDSPLAASNDKHLFVADRGAKTLDVFSAYSLLYTHKFDYPVLSLTSTPTGRYGVVTSALGYKSGVKIFDPEFRVIFEYNFADRYTTRLAISDDGKNAIAATFTSDANGDYKSIFCIFKPDESAVPVKNHEFTGELPLYTSYFDDGSYALLTNRTLRFFDKDGQEKSSVSFSGRTVKKFFSFGSNYALTFADSGLSNATTVSVYDSSGNNIINRTAANDVTGIDIIDENMYYYSAGTLFSVSLKGEQEDRSNNVGTDFMCLRYDPDGDGIIAFYKNTAIIYSRDGFFEAELTPPK